MFEKKQPIGAVLCARMQSSRVPGKVLARVGKMTVLEHIVQNFRAARIPIVVAIPEDKDNDILAKAVRALDVPLHRGWDTSPLHRMAHVAAAQGWEHVIRVTQDDIFQDSYLIKKQIQFHVEAGNDYTPITGVPRGADQEIIKCSTLIKVAGEEQDPTEYVVYPLMRRDIKTSKYVPPVDYHMACSLSIDYPEDLAVARIIHGVLKRPFGILSVLNLLKDPAYKFILDLNRQPMLSVYTCVKDGAEFIDRALASVINQKHVEGLELVVVDDGSIDGTLNHVIEFVSGLDVETQKHIRLTRNFHSMGVAEASNQAVKMARGKYVIRLDADDELEPEAAFSMIAAMETARSHNDMVAACYSGYTEIGPDGATLKQCWDNSHPGGAMFLRSALLDTMFMDVPYGDGAELFVRFAKRFAVTRLDKALWKYHRHPDSKTAKNPGGPAQALADTMCDNEQFVGSRVGQFRKEV